MNKSESIKNIAGALVKFQASVSKVAKESNNPFFKKKSMRHWQTSWTQSKSH
jgi:hypothetical protein